MADFQFKEPVSQKYIYIVPETNDLQLLLPVVAGGEAGIGTDNTCKTVLELQEFFGLRAGKTSAKAELVNYKMALMHDISLLTKSGLQGSQVYNYKQQRLHSIDNYLQLLDNLSNNIYITTSLLGRYPKFPQALSKLLQKENNNIFSVKLNPTKPDSYSRMGDSVFAVTKQQKFGQELRAMISEVSLKSHDPKQLLINSFAEYRAVPTNDKELAEFILALQADIIKLSGDKNVNLKQDQRGQTINLQYFEDIGLPLADYSVKEIAENVLNASLTDGFWDSLVASPFIGAINSSDDLSTKQENLSILSQFFLAQINVYCYAQALSKQDFGLLLESNANLRQQLLQVIKNTLTEGASMEYALFVFINTHKTEFQLSKELIETDFEFINNQFKNQMTTIKESPHFDEFMLFFPDKPGKAVCHHNLIAVGFAEFCQEFKSIISDQKMAEFLAKKQEAFSRIKDRKLHHKNSIVNAPKEQQYVEICHPIIVINEVIESFTKGLTQQITELQQNKLIENSKTDKQLKVLLATQNQLLTINKITLPAIETLPNTPEEQLKNFRLQATKNAEELKTLIHATKSGLDTVGYPSKFKAFLNKLLDMTNIFHSSHRASKATINQTLLLNKNTKKLTTAFNSFKNKNSIKPVKNNTPNKPTFNG